MRLAPRLTTFAAAAFGVIAILALPGVAAAKDRNHDRIPDRWEHRHHLSTNVDQARRDQDHDGLRNRAEFLAGDNPRDRDSDNDGVVDGDENAGTIQSFDAESGRLVIDLFGGETISGLVTEGTEIKCEHEHADDSIAMRHGEDEQGDDNGGRGEESGDDNGGQGEAPGDDNSGPGNGGEDNSGSGSNNSGPGRGGDEESTGCTGASLVAGAVVQEAELQLGNGAATFEEVELAG
jgi:hypothetical protein